MIFPQIGNGLVQGTHSSFQTTIQLVDGSTSVGGSKGSIEFYDDEGNPLVLTVDGVAGSVFPFELADGESRRFTTSGTGALRTGWAHVHSDQPIGGASSFGISDSAGNQLTDVGVSPSSPGTEFTIFADSVGESQTGVAVANSSETEALTLEFELNRTDGTTIASRERTLAPLGHLAIFLFELFEGVEGISEFEGSMVIRSLAGPQPAVADSLGPPALANPDSTASAQTFTAVTPSTGGQALPPPRDLSVQLDGQNRPVVSWELPEPASGGGGSDEFVDETEPNNFESPAALEIGQTARGTIDPDFDEDVWRFEGTAGQRVVIDVEAESIDSALDSVIVLFLDQDLDEDGFPDEIAFNDDFGESFDSRLEVTLPETSSYLIQIFDSFDDGAPDFFYEMSLSLATNESSESNLSPTTGGPTLQGFNIYRSVTPASPQVTPADRIANVGAEVTTFADENVQQSATYRYIVTAAYDQGESPPSNQVETTTPGPQEKGLPFAGITLRSTGDQLTSLPMASPPPEGSEVTNLAFPHVGDGIFGNIQIKTSAILFNNTPGAASATIDFFNSDSTPMLVTIGQETATSFDVNLSPKGVVRLTTSGLGNGVGWARVTMDRHLAGSAIFQLFEAAGGAAQSSSRLVPTAVGDLITEVGVAATRLFQRFNLIVTSLGQFDTGLAIAFPPIEEGDEAGVEQTFNASLFDNQNRFIASKQGVTVPRQGHTSLFVSELFPNLPESAGVDIREFEGILQVTSQDFMAPLALRSAAAKLTSTPTLQAKLNGFAPTSTIEFAQTLTGTSPGIRWRLHQNDSDFVLEKLRISAPDLGLNRELIEPGDTFAIGYFARGTNSRSLELIARAETGLEFDLVFSMGDGVFTQGSGKMEGTANGNLTLELALQDKKPFSEVADDADQHFFFLPGLINAPGTAGPITITTEFTSVSSQPQANEPIVRRITQEVTFVESDSAKANLEQMTPLFPQPGGLATLIGTNLGDSPTVFFPSDTEATLKVEAARDAEGQLQVSVPPGVADGAISVDNGMGPGNALKTKVLFGPTFGTGFVEGEETQFFFRIKQAPEQFALHDFRVQMLAVDALLNQLSTEEGMNIVGNGVMKQGFSESRFNLKVASAQEETAVLQVVAPSSGTPLGTTIQIKKLKNDQDEVTGLQFNYRPDDPEEDPVLLDEKTSLELLFNFTELPVQFPGQGLIAALLNARMVSAPTGVGGADSAIIVTQGAPLVR